MLNRYAIGEHVKCPQDHSDLAALISLYDATVPPGELTKSGNGVAFFEKGRDLDHPGNTVCFFVVRLDGSKIDFSLGRALDAASGRYSR